MRIHLRFFASVRENLGTASETVDLPADVTTAAQARAWLRSRGAPWDAVLDEQRAIRMAWQQVMCDPGQPLADGGELAFFPPVTGG